jgi:1-acyl-sn-glycerol-3-phosphate acyltransferase
MAELRSVLFTVIMFVSVVPYSIAVILARLFGESAAYHTLVGWTKATVWLCKVLCKLDYKLEGAENIPRQNAVVLMKHSSTYETFVQFLLFPRQCVVLKRELMWAPFLGWALAAIRPIAINRTAGRSAVEQVVQQGCERLEKGIWVIIFPEGTRMPAGETRRYGVGGALLAKRSGRMIIPVAHNAGDFWPRRGWKKRPGTVSFCVGPAIDPRDRNAREVNALAQDWIERKVAELRKTGGP